MIEAVIVNHNTSPFAELCLRTLLQAVPEVGDVVNITVADNHSTDPGRPALEAAAESCGATWLASRWPVASAKVNTHGDVLRDFVLGHRDADAFLFLDADIVFVDPTSLEVMREDLLANPGCWAVQARFAWSENARGGGSSLDIGAGAAQRLYVGFEDPDAAERCTFPVEGVGQPRCHPGCALVRSSAAFLAVAERFGFATAVLLSADQRLAGYYDTMAMASAVMRTHGLGYALSRAAVVHYFNVSYDERVDLTRSKLEDVARRLAVLRADPLARTEPGPWG